MIPVYNNEEQRRELLDKLKQNLFTFADYCGAVTIIIILMIGFYWFDGKSDEDNTINLLYISSFTLICWLALNRDKWAALLLIVIILLVPLTLALLGLSLYGFYTFPIPMSILLGAIIIAVAIRSSK
jgi:hypothetical protein